jgi:hypothetical protein
VGIHIGGSVCGTYHHVTYHNGLTAAVFLYNLTDVYTALVATGGWFRHDKELCNPQVRNTFWYHGKRKWRNKRFRGTILKDDCGHHGGKAWWMNNGYVGAPNQFCGNVPPYCSPLVKYGTTMEVKLWATTKTRGTWYRASPSGDTVGVPVTKHGSGSIH